MADIHMKDGREFRGITLDGGGAMVVGENAGRREVHGTALDGSFFCEFGDEIERIIDSNGQDITEQHCWSYT